jgi:hypothetical protein
MQSVADLMHVDPARSAADEASIRASWDRLAELLELDPADGGITEGQFQWLLAREPDVDAGALMRREWARTLRRAVAEPRAISVDLDALKSWPCRCGPGQGWIYEDRIVEHEEFRPIRVTYAKPCPVCNGRQRALWAGHWIEGGDHRCPECRPRGGKTPTPLAGDRDERRAEQAAEREAADDAILFGTDDAASYGGGLA